MFLLTKPQMLHIDRRSQNAVYATFFSGTYDPLSEVPTCNNSYSILIEIYR